MRIKKFRLAEGFACIFLAVVGVVAAASDTLRARSGETPPAEMGPAAGLIVAVILFAVGAWLLRDSIRRAP